MTPCTHENFKADVDVIKLTKADGEVEGYTAEMHINCGQCGEAFEFIGIPLGSSPREPAANFDGTEARLPIRPVFGGQEVTE